AQRFRLDPSLRRDDNLFKSRHIQSAGSSALLRANRWVRDFPRTVVRARRLTLRRGPHGELISARVGKMKSSSARKGIGFLQNPAAGRFDGGDALVGIVGVKNHERASRSDLVRLS